MLQTLFYRLHPATLVLFLLVPSAVPARALAQDLEIDAPRLFLSGIGDTVRVRQPTDPGRRIRLTLTRGGSIQVLEADADPVTGTALFDEVTLSGYGRVGIEAGRLVDRGAGLAPAVEAVASKTARVMPGLLTILPPVLAIVMALLFRQVVLALVAGIGLGALFLNDLNPVAAFLRIIDHYVVESLAGADSGIDNTSIFVFTLLLGGMVGVFTRMGGTRGMVSLITRIATNGRRGQLATWLMGVFIFFDDYTNTLIVGNTMRPVTDRLRISREKLAYLVDSTAAPVACLAIITSWIGFEVSLIDGALADAGIERNPFAFFVQSIPYSFYPIFALLFVLLVAILGRDFGPMLRAERRARERGMLVGEGAQPLSDIDSQVVEPPEGVPSRWWNAAIPILTVIVVTIVGLIATGGDGEATSFFARLKEGNSFTALLWSSLSGCLVAILLAVGQRLLSVSQALEAWTNGIRSMIPAILILVMAWSIALVCKEIRTADYLIHSVQGFLSPYWLPSLVFVIAMGVSFSTGTSWGTMSILIPIVIPLAAGLIARNELAPGAGETILLASSAGILSGAIFGDHCSPISDTTIMSSMASACDHVDHVRTQLPYAIIMGAFALVFGVMPAARGMPPWICVTLGTAGSVVLLRLLGRPVERPAA